MKESDKDLLREWLTAAASAMILLVLLLLMVAMGGCTRRVYVPAESISIKTDTDSLTHYIRDLVMQSSQQKEKETMFIYRDRTVNTTVDENGNTIRTDTNTDTYISHDHELESENKLLTSRNDSLTRLVAVKDSLLKIKPVEVEKIVEVERKLTWWEKTRLNTWGWLMAALLLCCGWLYRKPLLSLVRRLLTKTT